MNSQEGSGTVRRLRAEELPPRSADLLPLTAPPLKPPASTDEDEQAPVAAPAFREPSILEVAQAAFLAAGLALSARALLLLAILGGFALALIAVQTPSWPRLAIVVAYAVLVVLPIVWLEAKRGR